MNAPRKNNDLHQLDELTAGAFLAYPEGFAKPLIIVIEIALMPTLTLILGLLVAGAPEREAAA